VGAGLVAEPAMCCFPSHRDMAMYLIAAFTPAKIFANTWADRGGSPAGVTPTCTWATRPEVVAIITSIGACLPVAPEPPWRSVPGLPRRGFPAVSGDGATSRGGLARKG